MARNSRIDKLSETVIEHARSNHISDGLSEIYQDDSGQLVDVSKLNIRRKHSWLKTIIGWMFTLLLLAAVGYGIYYFINSSQDLTNIEMSIDGERSVMNGQDITYKIKISNSGRVAAKNLELQANLPANFILSEEAPAPLRDKFWTFDKLDKGANIEVAIKGRLYNLVNKNNIITADLSYKPDSFSSAFKKSASLENVITQSGIEYSVVKPENALVGEKQKMVIKYKRAANSNIDNFRLSVEPTNAANIEFVNDNAVVDGVTYIKPWVWQVFKLDDKEHEITVNFKFIDRVSDKENFHIKFDYRQSVDAAAEDNTNNASTSSESRLGVIGQVVSSTLPATSTPQLLSDNDKYYPLIDDSFDMEVIKNDLNLLLILNGSDKDQTTDFDQTLHYSVNYANKGEADLGDVAITVALDGDLIDWNTVKDKNNGVISDGTISWTKENLPALANIEKGQSGAIDFSIKVKDKIKGATATSQEITGISRFSAGQSGDLASLIAQIKRRDLEASRSDTGQIIDANGNKATSTADIAKANDNKNNSSNTIVCKMNSDLQLDEKLRYFDDDNIPVGSGPMPLEFGKTTKLRVYWQISNTLHNLSSVQVRLDLPPYVRLVDNNSATLGNLSYDSENNRIVWEISQLARDAHEIKAEFNVAVTPTTEQKNQLLIILPNVSVIANDDNVGAQIKKEVKPKTSKLEDDDIIKSVNIDMNGGLVK